MVKRKLKNQAKRKKKQKKHSTKNKVLNTYAQIPPEVIAKFRKRQIEDIEREQLLGDVRPIIHHDFKGYKFVAVGNELHYAKHWKTFPDFLFSYIANRLGVDWGNNELKKPFEERHHIFKWYDSMAKLMKDKAKFINGLYGAAPNGAFLAYLSLAYDLYILKDNLALQEYVVKRLKHPDQFQGARHELFATATCIRAGFSIEFEDERDKNKKHPEFIATHKITGQKIAVEAKSKHRKGVLGYSGKRQSESEIKFDMTSLINSALKKANHLPLVVFADTNLPLSIAKEIYENERPSKSIQSTMKRLLKDENGRDLFNHILFTNHPNDYADDEEIAPQPHIVSAFSLTPTVMPTHEESLQAIHLAALQHGNIPNAFPDDF